MRGVWVSVDVVQGSVVAVQHVRVPVTVVTVPVGQDRPGRAL